MKMRFVEFEGTPEEFEQVKHNFAFSSASVRKAEMEHDAEEGLEPPRQGVSREEVHKVVLAALTRRPLESRMKAVLKALLKNKQGMTTVEFAKVLGITRAQLAGVLGAFGRRLSHTEGYPEDETGWIAKIEWIDGQRRYLLTPLGREVLTSGKVKLD
jgi:hypothetical protein